MHQKFMPTIAAHPKDEESGFAPRTPIQLALTVLRRQYVLIIIGLVVATGLGVAYLALTPPVYTAVSTMMIDSRRGGISKNVGLGRPRPDRFRMDR